MTTAHRVWRVASRLPARVVIGALVLYRRLISPLYPPSCRYYPSCSSYALTAVRRHGLVRGSWLALRRLARCHPWALGGVDDVPPARSRGTQVPTAACGRTDAHGHALSVGSAR